MASPASASTAQQPSPPPVVSRQAVEKLRDQPGVSFPAEQDPHTDEFVQPVMTIVQGTYKTPPPRRIALNGLAHTSMQATGRPTAAMSLKLQQSFVEDIMPPEDSVPLAVGSAAPEAGGPVSRQTGGGTVLGGLGAGSSSSSTGLLGGGAAGAFLGAQSKTALTSSKPAFGGRKKNLSAPAAASDMAEVRIVPFVLQ